MAYNKSGWQGQPKDAENVTRPADAAQAQKRTRKRKGVRARKTGAALCPLARMRALGRNLTTCNVHRYIVTLFPRLYSRKDSRISVTSSGIDCGE